MEYVKGNGNKYSINSQDSSQYGNLFFNGQEELEIGPDTPSGIGNHGCPISVRAKMVL